MFDQSSCITYLPSTENILHAMPFGNSFLWPWRFHCIRSSSQFRPSQRKCVNGNLALRLMHAKQSVNKYAWPLLCRKRAHQATYGNLWRWRNVNDNSYVQKHCKLRVKFFGITHNGKLNKKSGGIFLPSAGCRLYRQWKVARLQKRQRHK